MSIECDISRFADIELVRMNGRPCLGSFGLIAQVQVKVPAFPTLKPDFQPILVEAEADISVAKEGSGENFYLGRFRPSSGPLSISGYTYAYDHDIYFFHALSPIQMESIEKVRAGGNLNFTVTVYARIKRNSDLGQQERTGGDQTSLRVNSGTWIEVLHQLKFNDTMLIEVPIGVDGDVLAQPIDRLRNARLAFERGEWREAVGLCRNSLETLETALGDGNASEPQPKERSKEDRYRHWRKALLPLIHSAKHDDKITEKFTWDRHDAVAAIATVAALLQRYKSI